ncbi:MAG: nucleotidyltransferase family protein [Clostridiales bacterium]|nr:nucleotidyltransferase family protein [Clostridiales bacterium]
MEAVGIVAEYNPFHNGHEYHMRKARKESGAEAVVVAMSGDFVQRGEPAIVDKYARAEMALRCGADVVLEIPAAFSTASAEFFASAGVDLLAATGVVGSICYGTENEESGLLKALAEFLSHPSEKYEKNLSQKIKTGINFPTARAEAIAEELPGHDSGKINEFLSQPNNILALEYEKEIILLGEKGITLRGVSIPRVGDGYHEKIASSSFASATAIRNSVLGHGAENSEVGIENLMPVQSFSILSEAMKNNMALSPDDFSSALYAALLAHRDAGYENFADCSPALSQRIQAELDSYTGFSDFIKLLKTRELTYTRISRVLIHILLNISSQDCAKNKTAPQHIRVLGFKKESEKLLSEISKKASVPLITSVADAKNVLPESAMEMLGKDIYAADLYRGILSIKNKKTLSTEYTRRLLII